MSGLVRLYPNITPVCAKYLTVRKVCDSWKIFNCAKGPRKKKKSQCAGIGIRVAIATCASAVAGSDVPLTTEHTQCFFSGTLQTVGGQKKFYSARSRAHCDLRAFAFPQAPDAMHVLVLSVYVCYSTHVHLHPLKGRKIHRAVHVPMV